MNDLINKLGAGLVTNSPEETGAIAQQLAKFFPENGTLALHGDLGVGKTTFIKGFAKGLGITKEITSPSFSIYTTYKGNRNLIHIDAYRLNNEEDMDTLMLEEFLKPPYALVVEWPEKIENWLDEETWHLTLSIETPGHHKIILKRSH